MKGLSKIILFLTLCLPGQAQTLFTYGPGKVTSAEFMSAYRRNNTGVDDAKAREDYLELYTRFRLKVQEAYAMKLDTLSSQRADLQGFRRQIEGPYLTDNEELDRMTEEDLLRGLEGLVPPAETEDDAAHAGNAGCVALGSAKRWGIAKTLPRT